LERVVIYVLKNYGVFGERLIGSTGVWVSSSNKHETHKKICAMGVRASRWVTMHGLAFNVDVNLDYFNNIVPCGIQNKGVTSLKNELNREVSFVEVELLFKQAFEKVFNVLLKD
jgi:lipoyl(octanoyl) transferase